MLSDDEVKREFKIKAQKEPDKYYSTVALKELGFVRKLCNCGQVFWSVDSSQIHCGEPSCSGGLSFINNSPAKKKLDYIEVWREFSRIHQKLGYSPINRYPVVARWNPTTDFTIASIAAFQPYVVSGEISPPANPLVIPQFCLRFPDIDNVGITGHFVGFVMMGQHAFVEPKKYDINKYLRDHLCWLNEGMGLSNKDITIHEDSWAGGGNFGPCMEFFSRGLEISNQVYMQYENTPSGPKELKIKVLDMGQGQERASWFTQGKPNSYETTFPTVIKKLREITGVSYDEYLMGSFAKLSQKLKVDNGTDIEKAWIEASKKLNFGVDDLKNKILPLSAIYSISEHTRALLVALNDGALPSNVGGMYNLRVILRRALGFIKKYDWNIDICDVASIHADYLKPLFPELSENLESIKNILEFEKSRYISTQEKIYSEISKIASSNISDKRLIELYDNQGISPELVKEESEKLGKSVRIPENFYALVAKKHEKKEQETQTERHEKIDFGAVPATKILYFGDWKLVKCSSKVLTVNDSFVVLNQTVFYPVSGGQMNDIGTINSKNVIDVFKQGNLIVHKLDTLPSFKAGDTVECIIDFERRKQLTQHHTATHIINSAARIVLGEHINQASAKKDVDKAYLDVTHYQLISEDELKKIEIEANKIVQKSIPVVKELISRAEAEKKYGMHIYQGGAVPGKEIRIVSIPKVETEACGGTHLNNTAEAEKITIIKASKIKDGVVRIFFLAGKAADNYKAEINTIEQSIAKELDVGVDEIPARVEELFELWKKARKAVSKKQKIEISVFSKKEKYSGDVLSKTSEILSTQQEHILKTIQRLKKELDEFKKQIDDF